MVFYVGGVIFLAAVSWTVFRTKEYSPKEMASFFEEVDTDETGSEVEPSDATFFKRGMLWLVVGVVGTIVIDTFSAALDRNLYILSLGLRVSAFAN